MGAKWESKANQKMRLQNPLAGNFVGDAFLLVFLMKTISGHVKGHVKGHVNGHVNGHISG